MSLRPRICRRAIVIAVMLIAVPTVWAAENDTDGDTISDTDEGIVAGADVDSDTIPDYQDLDSEGDGLPDAIEAGDTNLTTPPVDTDGDKIPDFRDLDSDADKILDAVEDANGNGVVDGDETDARNPDTDGDGVWDGDEDKNHNGLIEPGESNPRKTDSDGDGIDDAKDQCPVAAEDKDGDQDEDGCPDGDFDIDGIPDAIELGHTCLDWQNPDTDGDGLKDGQEDVNHNGLFDRGETNPCDADTDNDTVLDSFDKCPLAAEDMDGDQDQDGCPEGPGFDFVGTTDGAIWQPDAGPDARSADGGGNIGDSDDDGLPDDVEKRGCTNYQNPDTDGDGRTDGMEDRNHNGVMDATETDPCTADVAVRGGGGCACDMADTPSHLWGGLWCGLAVLLIATYRKRFVV